MNRKLWTATAMVLFGIIIFIAALIVALCPSAGAQPDVSPRVSDYATQNGPTMCARLDRMPGPDGVAVMVLAITHDGLTGYQAGQAIGLAVILYCPDHTDDLDAFIAEYGG